MKGAELVGRGSVWVCRDQGQRGSRFVNRLRVTAAAALRSGLLEGLGTSAAQSRCIQKFSITAARQGTRVKWLFSITRVVIKGESLAVRRENL